MKKKSLIVESELAVLDLLCRTTKDGGKVYVVNTENLCRIFNKHPQFTKRFRYDEFKALLEYRTSQESPWRQLEDSDVIHVQTELSVTFDFLHKVGKEMVYDAIIKTSRENAYDSAKDYIKAIKWDETPRLDSWLTHTYGTPEDVYHKAVGANWLKGLVKRIIEPGCKFDYVLVIEGEQGIRKSASLAVLGGDWYVETTMSTDSKDFFMQFQGKAIIEFSEGETLNRTEVKRMKAIITTQYDKYRPPYGRVSVDFPRRCVFAMTTNQSEYLKDETGNRRWLPITVVLPEANIEWLAENRDQLLAEAYHRAITLKEKIYEFPREETAQAQDARRIRDPNLELIANWYYNDLDDKKREEGITIDQVFRDALNGGFGGRAKTKWEEMSIANVLKNDLKLERRFSMRNGVRANYWYMNPSLKLNIQNVKSF